MAQNSQKAIILVVTVLITGKRYRYKSTKEKTHRAEKSYVRQCLMMGSWAPHVGDPFPNKDQDANEACRAWKSRASWHSWN